MQAEMDARVRAVTNEEWAAMAVRAGSALSKQEKDALDAAESEYHRQEREDETKVSSFADMLQMWKGAKPDSLSPGGGAQSLAQPRKGQWAQT